MAPSSSSSSSVRARFKKMIREAQDPVCTALEAADGGASFKEDVWSRPGSGGGISRVLQDGAIWEKAGVNVSVVYGIMPLESYRAAKAAASSYQKPGPIPFFTTGISSVSVSPIQFFSISDGMGNDINLFQVLHPKNPFAPTLHIMIFYPYFRAVSHTIITTVLKILLMPISKYLHKFAATDCVTLLHSTDAPGAPRQWWFGGGTDLTPAYIFEEDVKHFHSIDLKCWMGYAYTWSNNQVGEANIQERLDRAVAITNWKEAFLEGVIRPLSNPNRCSWGELKKEEAIYFQIRRMWLRDSECKEIIKRSWVMNYDQIEEKLEKCIKALQEWRKEKFRELPKKNKGK
ncbi:hypothetical protein Ahy_B09g095267 [Arachis hypogaea]|uniref:coproporphyrinogen oxidase n=1 Tax=Arachis hypogaea TaxID=3818 RepID=A0A444XDB8_ARAHY|nr:hypothetical protein Ahy_B09g095267 [Arachis hypogaea]